MSDWRRGFPLARLKQLAAPFRERHKALVFGAFGLVKERDIAESLAKNMCAWTKGDGAVALMRRKKAPGEIQDFTGRPCAIPREALVATAFAARTKAEGVKLIKHLLGCRFGPGLWLELFAEDDVAVAAAEECGLVYSFTRIAAGSEVKTFYCCDPLKAAPALPPEELATLEVLKPGWIDPSGVAEILRELAAAEAEWAQHYSGYNKRKSWTAFALRGFDDDPSFIIKPAEMSKSWKAENGGRLGAKPRWTSIAIKFSSTLQMIDWLGCEFERVRFMRLRARDGELSRHADITDRDAGVQDGRITRLHIPLVTSEAVTFHGWTARGRHITRHFPVGALCYLDQRKPHRVVNADPALDRIHLVLDCVGSDSIRKLIRKVKPERKIRTAVWADRDRLVAMAREQKHTAFFYNYMYSDEAAFKKGLITVLEQDGELLGFCNTRHKKREPHSVVYFLCVHSSARGQGIGRELLTHAEQQSPHPVMRLEVADDNPLAIKFYERHGYRATGERGSNGRWYEKRLRA